MTMKALIFDPNVRRGLCLADVAEPKPAARQALVEVHAISLNFGELAFLEHMHKPGDVPGWTLRGWSFASGRWVRSATGNARHDSRLEWSVGRAPRRRYKRVCPTSCRHGFWGGKHHPGGGSYGTPGTPLSRLGRWKTGTRDRRLRRCRKLCRAACAVRRRLRRRQREQRRPWRGLRKLGAREVIVDLEAVREPFHGVLDNVGGSVLSRAFKLVAPGGTLVSIGNASLEPSTMDFEQERSRGGDRRIEVFTVGGAGYGPDLSYLVD